MAKEKKPQRFEEQDDGRSVANMNVEGMPWYVEEEPEERPEEQLPPMSRRETRAFLANALLATLAVAAVFLAAAALFILFCTKVWFR